MVANAGAGTGKTTTLVGRLWHMLVNEHIPPQHILAVTFTKKAANELRERVARLGAKGVGKLRVATFHSIAFDIVRRHYREAGFSSMPVVWGSDPDRRALVKEAMRCVHSSLRAR